MNGTINGTAITITNAGQPLKINVNMASAWWQFSFNQELPWLSVFGFTVDGVRDAYKITSIPNYYALAYYAWLGTQSGVNFDALVFFKVNDAYTALLPIGQGSYGAAFRPPTFTSDGRIIFTNFGTLGEVPFVEQPAFLNTRNRMLDPNGYYIIQTGDLTFDMVSRDGKAWITWQWPQ